MCWSSCTAKSDAHSALVAERAAERSESQPQLRRGLKLPAAVPALEAWRSHGSIILYSFCMVQWRNTIQNTGYMHYLFCQSELCYTVWIWLVVQNVLMINVGCDFPECVCGVYALHFDVRAGCSVLLAVAWDVVWLFVQNNNLIGRNSSNLKVTHATASWGRI